MSSGDLKISLIVNLINQVAGPARAVVGSLRQIGAASERMGGNTVAWANKQIAANNARASALRGEAFEVAALGAALIGITEPAIQAERQLAEVSKVVSFNDANGLRVLHNDIQNLVTSGGLAQTADGVLDIVAAAGRMGVVNENLPDAEKRKQLLEFASAASKMAVAFGISADEAGTTLARWRQNLQLSQSEAMLLGDTVNLLGNTMATNEAHILQVINRQGVVAKTAGLAANEIAALSATLLAAGASPEIASTGLKNFTNAMVKGESATKRQSDAFKVIGIDGVELAKRMQTDAAGGILMVLEAFQKIEPYRRNSLVGDLFGEEAKGAITPLIENTELLRETLDKTADSTKLLGLMEEEYQRQAETTFAQRKRLLEFVKALSVTIGNALLPGLNDLMATLMPLVGTMTEWAAAHPEVIKWAIALVGGMVALKAATLAGAFAFSLLAGPILQIIRIGGVFLRLLGMFARITPFGALMTAITLLWIYWDDMAKFFTQKLYDIVDAFDKGFFQGILKIISEFNPFTLMIEGIQALMAEIAEFLGVPDQLVAKFREIDLFQIGKDLMKSLSDGMLSLLDQLVQSIKAKFANLKPAWLTNLQASSEVTTVQPNKIPRGARARGRDTGGPALPGIAYQWQERGREFFVPDVAGTVLPTRVIQDLERRRNKLTARIDKRPTIAARGLSAPQSRGGDTISITIHPAPGADPQQIAREVARQLQMHQDDRRGDLHDGVHY